MLKSSGRANIHALVLFLGAKNSVFYHLVLAIGLSKMPLSDWGSSLLICWEFLTQLEVEFSQMLFPVSLR